MGAMVLILLGDGVVANVLLKRSKAEGAGWMVITSGWAFAVMSGVFAAIACGSRDAHINPAVTVGVSSGNYSKVVRYIVEGRSSLLASGLAFTLPCQFSCTRLPPFVLQEVDEWGAFSFALE